MRFLIDGSAFAFAEHATEAAFWRRILPLLAARLESHELYFLTRGGAEPFEAIPLERRLQAPPPDFKAHRVEERRLSSLCRNMGINVFVSTSYTAAGTKTPSVFVLTRPYPYFEPNNLSTLLARDSAIRSASLCVVPDDSAAQYLTAGFSIPRERVRVVPTDDEATAAAELAETMLSVAQATIPARPATTDPHWTITKDELIAQFNAASVKNVYEQLVQAPQLGAQLDALHIIAWHCLTHRPQTYLEFGMHQVALAGLAAEIAPGIELYGSASIPLPSTQEVRTPSFEIAAQLMAIQGASATRYAIASPAEFVADLVDQAARPLVIDLAVIRADPSPADALAQIDVVRKYLGPRGVLIIAGQTPAEFSAMFAQIREQRPAFAYFPMRQGTAALAIPTNTP